MEAIWRRVVGFLVGFEGDLATDTWLHSSKKAGDAYFCYILGFILGGL